MSHEISVPKPSPVQQAVLAALVQGATITAAAEASNVHRTTVHYWCRTQPEFRLALQQAKQIHTEAVRDELRQLSADAISVLREIMHSKQAPPSVRLRAALAVIDATAAAEAAPLPDTVVPQAHLDAVCGLIGESGLRAARAAALFHPDSTLSSPPKTSAAPLSTTSGRAPDEC
jgi:transposase-like protein